MEWCGRHVNATADEQQRRHCVHRELQIPVSGDQGSFNVVREVMALEVHGWGSIPGLDYRVRY
jgi:hypothetical protein